MTRSLPARTSSFLAHPVAMLMVILGLAAIWLSAALEIWPLLSADEAIDASVAWSLLNQGRFATPLYPGLLKLDESFFLHPPLSILAATGPLGLWGMGLVQARIAPVFFGILAVGAVYLLGKELFNARTGVLAALLTLANPLFFVTARMLRPEVFVAALMLLSLFFLVRAGKSGRLWLHFTAGLAGGLAVLAHTYALLGILALLAAMVWEGGWQAVLRRPFWAFVAGLALPLLPYMVWVGANWEAYRQQASYYFDFFSGRFWIENILGETQRYAYWKLTLPSLPLGLAASLYAMRQFNRHRAVLLPILTFLIGFWLLIPNKSSITYLGLVVPLMNILLAQALDEAAKGWAWLRAIWSSSGVIALVALVATIHIGMISWRLITWRVASNDYRSFMAAVNLVLLEEAARPIIGSPFYWLGLDDKLKGSYVTTQPPFLPGVARELSLFQLPPVKDRAVLLMDDGWFSQLGGQPWLVTRYDRRSPPVGALFPLAEIRDPFYAAAGANAGQWQTMRILLWMGY